MNEPNPLAEVSTPDLLKELAARHASLIIAGIKDDDVTFRFVSGSRFACLGLATMIHGELQCLISHGRFTPDDPHDLEVPS
jgi:hypothetical protein